MNKKESNLTESQLLRKKAEDMLKNQQKKKSLDIPESDAKKTSP